MPWGSWASCHASCAASGCSPPPWRGVSSRHQNEGEGAMALRETGGRAVDIHAHFFPQAYLDVVTEEGARFGASYRVEGGNLFIKSPGGATGPISTIIVDLDARLGRMDALGVTVQALSLTTPMAYWGDAAF